MTNKDMKNTDRNPENGRFTSKDDGRTQHMQGQQNKQGQHASGHRAGSSSTSSQQKSEGTQGGMKAKSRNDHK